MNALIDTNIILDVALQRPVFCDQSSQVLFLSENKTIDGYLSASAVTDVYYFIERTYKDKAKAIEILKRLLKVLHIATVSESEIFEALNIDWNDFEDAVQYAAAENIGVDYIVTRNPSDFSGSAIPVLEPEAFLRLFIEDEE